MQELVDAADAVTWGLSLKMSGIVWRLRETTVPTVRELELVLERAKRLQDALAKCHAFVADSTDRADRADQTDQADQRG
ncbi:hypothetical protein VSH64_02795 [Amycolatopsis rhabdoformis]|uniref:Uncharacterized protein n=1 Tax=Amycolatopsis rhabdoformis TaxID=1448059 RepID=A0ABZ1IAG3_9PSEU|nr:hypothetical protein [Amycolatopsis rhabdoformis]WSE31056.1 hypothetical protein VSH64_02795 [Amycolatopsis rhabdoformis]